MTEWTVQIGKRLSLVALAGVLIAAWSARAQDRSAAAAGEWRSYGATLASTKYSPLDQINKNNVKNLRIAWRQSVTPMEVRGGLRSVRVPTNFEATPLMVGGLLYTTTGVDSVVALDPTTGKVLWSALPPE